MTTTTDSDRYAIYPYDDEPAPPTESAFYDQVLLRAVWMAYDNAADMGLNGEEGLDHAAKNWTGYLHAEVEMLFDEWQTTVDMDDEEPPEELCEFDYKEVYRRCAKRAPHVEERLSHSLMIGLGDVERVLGPYAVEQLLEGL